IWTAADLGLHMQFNNFIREYALTNRDVLIADPTPYLVNQSSSTSTPLPGMQDDEVHPTATGAYWMGKALNDVLSKHYSGRPTSFLVAADYYHAVNNPTGNLLLSGTTNLGLMAGTGGTATPGTNLTFVN